MEGFEGFEQEQDAVDDDAPEGAIVLGTILITAYMEIDSGDRTINVQTDSDLPLTDLLGQLTLAERWLLVQYNAHLNDPGD